MVMRSRTYPNTNGSKMLGDAMAVDQIEADFEHGEAEFRKVYTIMQSREASAKIMMSHPFTSTMQTASLTMLLAEILVHAA